MIVGSDISELRSEYERARLTRSRKACISWSRLSSSVWWIAGATRPPPRSAMATPTLMSSRRTSSSPCHVAFSSGTSRSASATALISSTPCSRRSDTARWRFSSVSQAIDAAHVDRVAEVEVRDLALRAAHRRRDRAPHRRVTLVDGARGCGRGRRGRRGGGRWCGAARAAECRGAAAAAGARPRPPARRPCAGCARRARNRGPSPGRRRARGRAACADGEISRCSSAGRAAGAEADGGAAGAAAGGPAGAAGAAVRAASAITASGVPTGTSVPGSTRVRSSTPLVNTSTSTSALSVWTTAITSPRLTASPGCFSQD